MLRLGLSVDSRLGLGANSNGPCIVGDTRENGGLKGGCEGDVVRAGKQSARPTQRQVAGWDGLGQRSAGYCRLRLDEIGAEQWKSSQRIRPLRLVI